MADSTRKIRYRFCRWLIRFTCVIVPRRFRTRFRSEWEAELEYREELLARCDRLDWRAKLEPKAVSTNRSCIRRIENV
jgi:hypothetical protein